MLVLRYPLLLVFFLLLCHISSATVFTVTTNADTGPGSLREAITLAAANGTAVQDQIAFNIADLTEAGRTIDLLSELPALSGNLVLDGSTQPGAVFGISGAKIKLILSSIPTTGYFTCLLIQDATQVEIYGLYLSFIFDPRSSGELYGIRIKNSSNITIGASGKGNVVSGWFWDIGNSYYNYYQDYSNTISLKGNIVGLSEFGTPLFIVTNPIAILLSDTYNLEVGGTAPGEGNQIFGDYYSIQTNHRDPSIPGSFFIKLINNKIMTDPTGTVAYYGGYTAAVSLYGSPVLVTDTNEVKTTVFNNVISGAGANNLLLLQSIRHLVKVMGNRFGTDITGANEIGSANRGILVSDCYKVLVGSDNPADINYFTRNETGIYNIGTPHLLITKNSFFCNGTGITISQWPGQSPLPFVTINTYTSTLIAGTSNPLARIEIFQNHLCSNYYGNCQGKTYITTVYADNSGNWSYTGAQPSAIIMTATTTDSATSEFPVPVLNQQSKTFVQPTCGKSNGSISGMQILNGTSFKWVDQNGSVVGTDTNLVNLKPGTYILYVSFGESGCTVNSDGITLENIQPPPTLTVQELNPTCGQKNGELIYYGNLNGLVPKVVNQLGDTAVFTQNDPYLNAGTYRLIAYPPGDFSCAVTYGPYTLTNQSGPSVDMSSAVIVSASCHASNGSIRALSITNVSGSSFYRWTDSAGNTVGNSPDLQNVLPGKYQLKFKDGGGCDTLTTDLFTVGDQGSISIDTSDMLITKSKCSANSGSIQNITVQNGTSFQWISVQSGLSVGAASDLTNIASGEYQLLVSNAFGCSNQTGNIFIPQTKATPVTSGFAVKPEACNRKDGSLSLNSFSGNISDFTFVWESITGQPISNSQTVQNLDSGFYSLYATDVNGCRQLVSTQHIDAIPAPLIVNAIVNPEICGEKNGSVNLNVNGIAPITYAWSDENGSLAFNAASVGQQSQGTYSVVITDANNCITTSPVYFIKDSTVLPDPPDYNNIIVLKGNTATLTPTDAVSGFYSLFPYGSMAAIDQNASGIFTTNPLMQDTTMYVSVKQGTCTSPQTAINIKVVTTLLITMPNAFTPNHDGRNDLFRVKYPDIIKTFKMTIYNRWGQLIYSGEDPYKGWDGSMNGIDQPVGGYVWMISYTDVFGNSKQSNGTVLLIR